MAKVVICPNMTQVIEGIVLVGYSASVIGPPNFSYAGDYQVSTVISVAANLTAWKNKIISEVAEKGVTVVGADVIVFGSPV